MLLILYYYLLIILILNRPFKIKFPVKIKLSDVYRNKMADKNYYCYYYVNLISKVFVYNQLNMKEHLSIKLNNLTTVTHYNTSK